MELAFKASATDRLLYFIIVIIIISYTQTITNLLHLQIITMKSNYRLQKWRGGGGGGK